MAFSSGTQAADERVTHALRRFDRGMVPKNQWSPYHRDVRDFIRHAPSAIDTHAPGENLTGKTLDSTASTAVDLVSRTYQENLTPSSQLWFGFKIPDSHPLAPLMEVDEVAEWWEDVSNAVFVRLGDSNFYEVMGEAYDDFLSFHTSNVYLEEATGDRAFNGFSFQAIPIGEYVFEEDHQGNIVFVGRLFKMSNRSVINNYNNPPEHVLREVEGEKKLDVEHEYIWAVFERDDYDDFKFDTGNKPIARLIIDVKDKVIVHESGFDEFPYAIARYSKASGEHYGRGPSNRAMPIIKSMQKITELSMIGLNRAVVPNVMTTDKNVLGSIRLRAGGITYVNNLDRIKEFPFSGRLDFANLSIEDRRQLIKDIYGVDHLIIPRDKNMTAFEVSELRSEFFRLLGPVTNRKINGTHKPLLLRSFAMMLRAGEFPDPPEQLDGLDVIDVDFVGQMAKAAKQNQVSAIRRSYSISREIAETHPEIMDNYDVDQIVRIINPLLGVPQEVLLDDKQVEEKRQKRAEARQQEQQQLLLAEAAEGIQKGGQGVKALVEAGGGNEQ